MLQLADLSFDIESATLCAAMADPYWCDTYNSGNGKSLLWALDVRTVPAEVDGEKWSPYVYHHGMALSARCWTLLAGQSISWDAPYDENGESNGGFYVWEHGDISFGELKIVNRTGVELDVEWSGVCAVNWNEKHGEKVEFSLKTNVRFRDINVRGNENDTLVTLGERLSKFLDLGGLVQGDLESNGHSYESGIAMANCKFFPAEGAG